MTSPELPTPDLITRDTAAFLQRARALELGSPACPKAVFLVAPEGFSLAAESASDNLYMNLDRAVDGERALRQHRGLQRALAETLPAICFAGDLATPDAVFPNNVFATSHGRLLIARMRHPVRQREAERADIRGFFTDVLGYALRDLRMQPGVGELTGSLVIDRARGLGFCGLSERCDEAGARAMHAAFGLRATLLFDLAPGEYHANVVLSVLAGRAVSICADGFTDPAVADAIAALYAPHAVLLSAAEKLAFAGNCIAPTADAVWMSEAAADALRPGSHAGFAEAGLRVRSVPLDEIEKAGGSLRCCVGEIF
ncbi:MAG TPA: arginine deiminase-related protein [Xanthomonadaceae bacterium]|nr:arginine deiminase-related protein [Xanthomonadaceae bacterium]